VIHTCGVNVVPYNVPDTIDADAIREDCAWVVNGCVARRSRAGQVREREARQRQAGEAEAKLPQRSAARDRLGEVLGEFIELSVHVFPFRFVV
jgi:hypothetical protein